MAFSDWSTTAANNATKPGINWAEGQTPASINDSARQMMADLAALAGTGIALPGRAVAIPGSKAKVDWVYDDASSLLENLAGLWGGTLYIRFGFNKVFTVADGSSNAPSNTMFVAAKNTGSNADVVAGLFIAEVAAASKTVFGMNVIAFSSGGVNNYKLVGMEIDIQPQSGTTPLTVGGLYLNVFTMQVPGPAIYLEGIFGGKWGTGISIGNLSSIGSGIGPASGTPSMGTLVDTGTATYNIAAIKLSNTHRIVFEGVSGNRAGLYVDSSNNMHAILPAASWVFRDNGDVTSLVAIDGGGSIDLQSTGVYKKGNVQVVGARDTGWVAMTGSPDKTTVFNTGTVTTAQLATRVKYIQDVLTTHGLIGA